eukprot:757617-Hanusia_phi.AAC.1
MSRLDLLVAGMRIQMQSRFAERSDDIFLMMLLKNFLLSPSHLSPLCPPSYSLPPSLPVSSFRSFLPILHFGRRSTEIDGRSARLCGATATRRGKAQDLDPALPPRRIYPPPPPHPPPPPPPSLTFKNL